MKIGNVVKIEDPLFDEPQYVRLVTENGTFCDAELLRGPRGVIGASRRIWIGDLKIKPITPFEASILEAKGEL